MEQKIILSIPIICIHQLPYELRIVQPAVILCPVRRPISVRGESVTPQILSSTFHWDSPWRTNQTFFIPAI